MARWYIIHAYSGFENKVKESILSEARRMGLEAFIDAVEVPAETVTEVFKGKKRAVEKKVFQRPLCCGVIDTFNRSRRFHRHAARLGVDATSHNAGTGHCLSRRRRTRRSDAQEHWSARGLSQRHWKKGAQPAHHFLAGLWSGLS